MKLNMESVREAAKTTGWETGEADATQKSFSIPAPAKSGQ